jgi:hypothetical protein
MVSFKKTNAYSALAALAAVVATPAVAQTTTTTAPVNVGGTVSVENSSLNGSISAVGINGSALMGTAFGSTNTANGYGGTTDITGTFAPVSNIDTFGSVVVKDSTLKSSNIVAATSEGSAFGSTAAGYNNISDAVGSVNQASLTFGNFTAPGASGIVSLSNTSNSAGDITGLNFRTSLTLDSAVGATNKTNNYGGYDSVTINTGKVTLPAAGSTAGSVIATASILNAGNLTAYQQVGSSLMSVAGGYNNTYNSVGSVEKVTFNGPTEPAPTTQTSAVPAYTPN